MSRSKFLVGGVLWLTAVAAALQGADQVFLVPGAGGTITTIPVFTGTPFNTQTLLNSVPAGAYQVLASTDASKYYVISQSGTSTTISVYDSLFAAGRVITSGISIPPGAVSAISPDGKRLVVLSSNVYIFDTASDTLVTGGAGIPITGTSSDLTFSIDGSKAYILSNNGVVGLITPIDLTTYATGAALTLPNVGAGIVLAPNGFLYVTTQNRLFEVNTRTFTLGTPIAFNAIPARPVPTPDGKYILAINRTPQTGAAIMIFDLATHTVLPGLPNILTAPGQAPQTLPLFDSITMVSSSRALVYSSQTGILYELSILSGNLSISQSSFVSSLPGAVSAFAVSNESPARSIFITANNGPNTLYKFDLQTNVLVGNLLASSSSGSLVAYASANPASGTATLTPFNATQVIQGGAVSLPLVVRAQDVNGRGVTGARIDFTTTTADAVLSAASAFANADGYAQIYVTAPNTPGAVVTVNAASGSVAPAVFTLTVPGTSGGGGGGGTGAASIKIVAGNGQLVTSQAPANQQLIVQINDANGVPQVGVPVAFSITQGRGTVIAGTLGSVNTDAKGQASAAFLADTVSPSQSFEQQVVTASSSIGSVDFTLTTVLSTLPGNIGIASPPVAILLTPDPDPVTFIRTVKGGAGTVIKGAIQVRVIATSGPQTGQAIPNVALNISSNGANSPGGSCVNQGGTPLSDFFGVAVCDLQLSGPVGNAPLNIDVGALVGTPGVIVQVTIGAPSKIAKTAGDAQTGKPGAKLPTNLAVRVTDASNNPLNNVPLTWTITPTNSATLSSTSATTDASGNGSTAVTLGNTPGTVTIKVTAGNAPDAPTATFTATVNIAVGGITKLSGDNQVAATNQPFGQALVVQVTDDKGALTSGIPVTFVVSSGSATFSSNATVTTDATGKASVGVTAGAAAGAVVITASAGSQSTTFNLSIRLPGPPINTASFVSGASGAPGLTPCGIALVQAPNLVPGVQGVVVANLIVGALPTALAGAELTVNGVAAPIYYVTSGAVAFQTPCETQPGLATISMRVLGGTTTLQGVTVTALQPGIFETVYNGSNASYTGRKYAVLLHEDGSYVTPENAARRGEKIKMFATGLGAVTPATGTGRAGIGGQTVVAPVTVGVNNGGVRLISAEYMTGEVGLYILTFEVPADTQTGPFQNLGLILNSPDGSAVYAPGSFIPIQ